MTAPKLTLTMQECVDFMKRHGGRIYRHKGGAWAGPNWKYQGGRCFTAATVKALVTRGVAEYTKKVKGQRGEFAVQAALVPSPPAAGGCMPLRNDVNTVVGSSCDE